MSGRPASTCMRRRRHTWCCVDLAGVEKEKIDVEVVDDRLTLRGAAGADVRPDYDREHTEPSPSACGFT